MAAMPESVYDLIVVGGGAAGMMAAITAARRDKRVLLLEKLKQPGAKLKATGGGRCNVTNTLPNETFIEHFGRNGRFMHDALAAFDHTALIAFYKELGVATHAPDGLRVFPTTHNSQSILSALLKELERLHVTLLCNTHVSALLYDDTKVTGVLCTHQRFHASAVIIATGGLGYPQLGAEGDGYALAASIGHTISALYPAMTPLHVKERWVAECRADTIAKATLRIDLPKAKTLRATGDLIFTKNGIRGPVVLDFAREITPFLQDHDEVPLLVNLSRGMNEEQIRMHIKQSLQHNPHQNVLALLGTLLPESLAQVLCNQSGAQCQSSFNKMPGNVRDALVKLLAWTPLSVIGHDGFDKAMITRGGVSLKEINPKTMQSKKRKGLYFCGEVMDLDGPCGGYNLQWSSSSGYVAGQTNEL